MATTGEKVTAAMDFDDDAFTLPEMKTLKEVVAKFATCNTSEIVRISHNEKAWQENEPARELISYQKYAFDLEAIR